MYICIILQDARCPFDLTTTPVRKSSLPLFPVGSDPVEDAGGFSREYVLCIPSVS